MNPAERFIKMFANRSDCYLRQGEDGSWWTVKEPLTLDLLKQHFQQKITLSLPAISVDNKCKWICWDMDVPEGKDTANILKYSKRLGLNPIIESYREKRFGHIWIFLSAPIDAEIARQFGQSARLICGLSKSCEFYPKSQLNGLRLPLGLHRKLLPDKFIGQFKDCSSDKLADQINWLLEQPLNDPQIIAEAAGRGPKIAKPSYRTTKAIKKAYNSSIMELIPEDWPCKKTNNDEIIALCPLCNEQGIDKKKNNLSIKPADNLMFCHYNGGEHKFTDIIRAFSNIGGVE